jgi:hypothetical protein
LTIAPVNSSKTSALDAQFIIAANGVANATFYSYSYLYMDEPTRIRSLASVMSSSYVTSFPRNGTIRVFVTASDVFNGSVTQQADFTNWNGSVTPSDADLASVVSSLKTTLRSNWTGDTIATVSQIANLVEANKTAVNSTAALSSELLQALQNTSVSSREQASAMVNVTLQVLNADPAAAENPGVIVNALKAVDNALADPEHSTPAAIDISFNLVDSVANSRAANWTEQSAVAQSIETTLNKVFEAQQATMSCGEEQRNTGSTMDAVTVRGTEAQSSDGSIRANFAFAQGADCAATRMIVQTVDFGLRNQTTNLAGPIISMTTSPNTPIQNFSVSLPPVNAFKKYDCRYRNTSLLSWTSDSSCVASKSSSTVVISANHFTDFSLVENGVEAVGSAPAADNSPATFFTGTPIIVGVGAAIGVVALAVIVVLIQRAKRNNSAVGPE